MVAYSIENGLPLAKCTEMILTLICAADLKQIHERQIGAAASMEAAHQAERQPSLPKWDDHFMPQDIFQLQVFSMCCGNA